MASLIAQSGQEPRLLDQVRHAIRLKHLAYSTEQTFIHWITRYFIFQDNSHPEQLILRR